MRILAIETIDKAGTVAVLDGERLLAELKLGTSQRSLQTLAPGIQKLLKQVEWAPRDVQLVAVATGPGSFTGLRIGVATAKTFAYAVGCEVQGVHTMAVLAAAVPAEHAQFSVVVDAQRNELFVADFQRAAGGSLTGADTTRIVTAGSWLASLPTDAVVTGPGLAKWKSQLPAGVTAIDEALWAPRAAAVGQLAWQAHQRGERCEVLALAPQYFRRTAAEEQWDRKHPAG